MPKKYFDFKKFRIYQDQCAMKVCTDSCLFAAWIDATKCKNILDIGTGTGLLSLMLAQRTNAKITAIEIDMDAYQQAKLNIYTSPFLYSISVIHTSLQDFITIPNLTKFDGIVCNPPFFASHLKSKNISLNNAKHDTSLTLQNLAQAIEILLVPEGFFWVMLPDYESSLLEKMLPNFTKLIHTEVRNLETDVYIFRVFSKYVFKKIDNFVLKTEKIAIKIANSQYSLDFEALLQEYYTIF